MVCPACKEPVAVIETRTANGIVFRCPDCGNLWRVDRERNGAYQPPILRRPKDTKSRILDAADQIIAAMSGLDGTGVREVIERRRTELPFLTRALHP